MNVTSASQWQSENFTYLTAAVTLLRQMLSSYVDNMGSQNLEKISDFRRELLEGTATLPTPPAFAQLGAIFSLSLFEQFVLLLCAAMELNPTLGRLCADAQGDEKLTFPTPYLALDILPEPSWAAFIDEAPLLRWQLIEVEATQVFTLSPMRIDKSILFYLLGESYSDRHLSSILTPISTTADSNQPLPPSHQRIAEEIANIWTQTNTSPTSETIQLAPYCWNAHKSKKQTQRIPWC